MNKTAVELTIKVVYDADDNLAFPEILDATDRCIEDMQGNISVADVELSKTKFIDMKKRR